MPGPIKGGKRIFSDSLVMRAEGSPKKKAPDSMKNQGLGHLVAWGGIEPPTRGFSIRCSTN
jgi:F420-dependent methylenetetrahydromethanopterin dehydrogenase